MLYLVKRTLCAQILCQISYGIPFDLHGGGTPGEAGGCGGVYNTGMLQVKGDPIADLTEDLGAEAAFN